MTEEKNYAVLEEADQIIQDLCGRYPKILWAVQPQEVVTLAITNKSRPETNANLAKIRKINAATKALLEHHRIPARYVIELYAQDWQALSTTRRQWLLFHEILHVPGPDESGLIRHDIEDFQLILDVLGVEGFGAETLPDMLQGEPVAFKEDLAVRLHLKKKSGPPDAGPDGETD